MIVAVDLFREKGVACVCLESRNNEQVYFPCFMPRQAQNFSTEEEIGIFDRFLGRLIDFFKSEYDEKLTFLGFVVPYHFTYLQKLRLKKIGMKYKAEKVRCYYSFEGNSLFVNAPEKNEIPDFFCNIEADRIEFGLMYFGDGVIETGGITGIKVLPGENITVLQNRLVTEINTLLKDCETERNEIKKLIVYGNTANPIAMYLKNYFGKNILVIKDQAVKGVVSYGEILSGSRKGILLITHQPFNISVALGTSGERAVAIDRYTTIPVLRKCKLLVSTEKMLNIYEGNYLNPKYDTLIASINLSAAQEGHEIECACDIDTNGLLNVVVTDDRGKILFK